MINLRVAAVAVGLALGAFSSGGASAAPVSAGGVAQGNLGIELAQWHSSRGRHVRGRCWWETRRMRDHRGRWTTRRVQVCPR
ncbi:hypothetical protein [Bosea sp. BK604]|uniref:hypothetical protein n=1 Tax=Bosea sp. BK604 TaxID=2512180 RepID=UPI00104EA467|nr:hypothetical protein [Bosea sp. BK604]